MFLFVIKAIVSGLLVATISLVAKRYPGWGGLVASLPLVSLISMLWLYGETRDPGRVADLAMGAFWFFLPSIPMFLVIPMMLRAGYGFGLTMALAVMLTLALYALMGLIASRLGISL